MKRRNIALVAACLAGVAWFAFNYKIGHGAPAVTAIVYGASAKPGQMMFLYFNDARDVDLIDGDINQHETGAASIGRVLGCQPIAGTVCVARGSRAWELLRTTPRQQGLVVLMAERPGENLQRIGWTTWTGPAHPERLIVNCDVRGALEDSCIVRNVRL